MQSRSQAYKSLLGILVGFAVSITSGGAVGCSPLSPSDTGTEPTIEVNRDEVRRLIRGFSGSRAAQREARERLVAIGSPALPDLIDALQSDQFGVRWGAVNVLGYIKDKASQPHLLQRVLRDPNNHVRWRAIWALNQVRDVTVVSELDAALQSDNPTTQWNAAVALSVMEGSEAVPVLHRGLHDKSSWTRWEAINALGRVHDEQTVAALSPLLKDQDDKIRQETVLSLGKIGTEEAAAILIHALSDQSPGVRWRAAMALAQTRYSAARSALEVALSEETDPNVKKQIERALRKLQN